MGNQDKMKQRFIPSIRGTFLLNGVPTRVEFAWSRCSYIVMEGEQAGTSVAMVKGTWAKIDDTNKNS